MKLPIITLTGERDNDHFEIRIDGKPAYLTASCLQALVALILGRGYGGGFAVIDDVTISRLRKAIDKVAGRGTGMRIVGRGSGDEYRLAIPKEELAAHIFIEEPFFELVGRKVIMADEAEGLRNCCAVVKAR